MLVLAMEFSRDAPRPPWPEARWGRADAREAGRSRSAAGVAKETTRLSLPQNGIVRSGTRSSPGTRGRPGVLPEKHGRTAAAGKRTSPISQ